MWLFLYIYLFFQLRCMSGLSEKDQLFHMFHKRDGEFDTTLMREPQSPKVA